MDAVKPSRMETIGNVTKASTPRWKPGDVMSQSVGAAFNANSYSTGKRSSSSIVEASTATPTRQPRGIELAVETINSSGANSVVR